MKRGKKKDRNKMSVLIPGFVCLSLFACYLVPFDFAQAREPQPFETGSAAKIRPAPTSPAEIKIISYNIRWRGGVELQRLIALLRDDALIGGADIIGLQEVDRNKKRTRNVNTARLMAEELGLHYAWAAPPPPADNKRHEEETGVALMSPYPLTDVTPFVLPNPGPGGRRRAAIGATVQVGATRLRVYSVHAETRTTKDRRLQQFQTVLDDLQTNHAKIERAVVLGDFNTITGKDVDATTSLFRGAGFTTPFSNSETTFKWLFIQLKNDWLWLRNLRALQYGIDKKIGLSDHWPLWVRVSLDATAARADAAVAPADIRGKITSLNRANAERERVVGTLLIEGVKESDTNVDRASVSVTKETRIVDRRGKERGTATFDDLKTGQKVEVRFLGPVMQSYPVQATASEIVILN
jgi:endonuclease/exonuclease/phosphatase family metal-dependent hydrolase